MAKVEAQPVSTASSEIEPVAPRRSPARGLTQHQRLFRRVGTPLYLAPALAVYGLFVLWPLLQVGWIALHRWNGFGPQTFVGLDNFGALLSDPSFQTSLWHSVLWEGSAVILPTLLALGMALLAARSHNPSIFLSVVFFPALLPATVVAAIWVLVYSPVSGLIDVTLRAAGLDAVAPAWLGDPHLALGALFVGWMWSVLGVGTLIFYAGIVAIGREYLEIALVEGAGTVWRFAHVIVPGIRRTGAIVLLVNAALGAAVFDLVFLTTGGGPGYATMILPLEEYSRAFGAQTGQGAAAACLQIALALIPVLLLIPFARGAESLHSGEPAWRGSSSSFPATVLVLLLLLILALPLLWLLAAALQPGRAFALTGPEFDPRHWEWSNFPTAWNLGMADAVARSLGFALGVVAGTLLFCIPAAFALAYHIERWFLKMLLFALLFIGLLQPTPVLIIPLFHLLHQLGLLDSPWGILLPEVARTLPFGLLVLWGFMTQLPREVIQAASVDGASPLQQLLRIVVPLSRPALAIVGIWAFVTSWNEYLLPTLVSQDGSLQTVPTLLATFVGKYDTQFGLLAAASLMAMAPSLAIYIVLRHPARIGLSRIESSLQ